MNTLAIDIGGTKLAMAILQGQQILYREQFTTNREGGKEWMLSQIFSIADKWQQTVEIERCGVSFGGPVDFKEQRVMRSVHVSGWEDVPLTRILTDRFDMPVIMDNDANVAALGEAIYGDNKEYDPLFYMTLSTGIGGGIIINRQIYRGANSLAGEIGHMTLYPDHNAKSDNFPGSYERVCSGLWLKEKYGESVENLFEIDGFIDRYIVDLAYGLKNIILILNPARIVIGGGISKAGDKLFKPLREELEKQKPHWLESQINIASASLGDDSPIYGALALSEYGDR